MSQQPPPPLFAQPWVEPKPMPRVEHFDGETFDADRDAVRLTRQLDRVRALMFDGEWRTLKEIAEYADGSEAAVSARLRDLRKPRFGGYTVERKHEGNGVYSYRVKQ